VRLPEQDHIPVVGIYLLVNILVQRGIAELDRAAFAEITLEESVQFIEQLFSEIGEGFQRRVDILLQQREHALLVVAVFDGHQVDKARIPFQFRADEDVAQGLEELLFKSFCIWHGKILEQHLKQKGTKFAGLLASTPEGQLKITPLV